MTPGLSRNTQAILLLTSPLIAGRRDSSPELLTAGEYKRLARYLREIKREPADLLSPEAPTLLKTCQAVVSENRLESLLGRGFLLSQAVARWHSRAIWVVSRADSDYPQRLKSRLREDSPPIIYGCGDISLAETGGLAVVGSRNVEDELVEFALEVGRLAASARSTIVSGGAKGIDRAAMRGASEAGGRVTAVLADSLESTTMNRENRNLLIAGSLVLLSPYDPNAGFNVGHAMQRNKLIYALADAALVVSADVNKGGTWAGASEQLDKLRFVPLYVRSTGRSSAALGALRRKGAALWPNPSDADGFGSVFQLEMPKAKKEIQSNIELFSYDVASVSPRRPRRVSSKRLGFLESQNDLTFPRNEANEVSDNPSMRPVTPSNSDPAAELFASVREVVRRLLAHPMQEADVAAALKVSLVQARTWLKRLVDEGALEKLPKPARYVSKQNSE